ncbi:MAG: trehalose-phosphatase, partial [Phycisphaerales bacterium]|nr:trehalose-phosphatase [Phycisphaerales bacterium]
MDHRLELIAQTPRLLVACDYDGVLSAIAPRPELALPLPGAMEELGRLANLAQTDAAIVSGRSLASLGSLIGQRGRLHLVGSHGAEISVDGRANGGPHVMPSLDSIALAVAAIAPESEGFLLERKPAGIAMHYRAVDPDRARRAVDAVEALAAESMEVGIRHGKMVVELSTSDMDKGKALQRLRYLCGATAVLFMGDDLTDEDAFRTMGPLDVSVKIGPGETEADERLDGPEQVVEALRFLAERRAAWLESMRWEPLERHSILSDQRTMAVVTSNARVVWMCLPRADSGAVFAELLGGPSAGYFSVRPSATTARPVQSYLDDTFMLRTEWPEMTVTDYLDCSAGRPFQRAGRTDLVRVLEGKGTATIEFATRCDFGRAGTRKSVHERGVAVEGFPEPIVLVAPGMKWRIEDDGTHHTARTEVSLDDGPVVLEMRSGTASMRPASLKEPERRRQTERFWSGWTATLTLPKCAPAHAALVQRSALLLRALCYGPTGAIFAAATTSLPEWPGGCRNWDYRFCWPRDAALAASALVRLGNTGVAARLVEALLRIVDQCLSPERLRPIYTITGAELGTEAELTHLPGYRASAPIRIGNAASEQVQLDVFGPIVDLVHRLAGGGVALTAEHWRLVESMVTAVERRWAEPDHGIWEIRDERRHHVYSKVMCWLAVDRAIRIADEQMDQRRESWEALRDVIREDVLRNGWSDALGAFGASYDQPEADASALHIGLSGLLPPDDPRFAAT